MCVCVCVCLRVRACACVYDVGCDVLDDKAAENAQEEEEDGVAECSNDNTSDVY